MPSIHLQKRIWYQHFITSLKYNNLTLFWNPNVRIRIQNTFGSRGSGPVTTIGIVGCGIYTPYPAIIKHDTMLRWIQTDSWCGYSSKNEFTIRRQMVYKLWRNGMGSALLHTGGQYACLILLQGVSSYLVLLVLERSMGLIWIALSGGRKSPSCSSCRNGSSDSMIAVSEAILAAAYSINWIQYCNSETNLWSLLSFNIFLQRTGTGNLYFTQNSNK